MDQKGWKRPFLLVVLLLVFLVAVCVLFAAWLPTLKQERVTADGQGALTVQMWEVTADGRTNYDIVVWRRTALGSLRVVYTNWVPPEQEKRLLDFGFRDGFFWYWYRVSARRDALYGPEKVFALL